VLVRWVKYNGKQSMAEGKGWTLTRYMWCKWSQGGRVWHNNNRIAEWPNLTRKSLFLHWYWILGGNAMEYSVSNSTRLHIIFIRRGNVTQYYGEQCFISLCCTCSSG
jgi:hypothetical protein